MTRSRVPVLVLFLACHLGGGEQLAAQKHRITDRSLTASLLSAAVPLPSTTLRAWGDEEVAEARHRVELQLSHSLGAAVSPLLIVGVRADQPVRDSTGVGAAVFGLRLGFAPEAARGGSGMPTALEVQIGGRRLNHLRDPAWPDLGLDVVVGWSGLDETTQGTVGVRVPVELARPLGRSRLLLSAAPAAAWGHVRFRECVNLGPDDGCGDLGMQLEFGRTRFLLAGGATLDIVPARVALSVGTQQLMVARQRPRLAVGMTWAP
jgi:hypothetical protein